MPEPGLDENSIHDFIVNAVQTAWEVPNGGSHKAMLLSALGMKLKMEFGDYSAKFPKGIKEFLRTWPLVQLVQHPEINEKIGLIPAGESLPQDITTLFQNASESNAANIPISYNQDFWNAFFKPIQLTRHVVINENGQLDILNDAANVPQGAYEISKGDIFSSDHAIPTSEKVSGTHDRINSWLAKNSLEASQFLRKHAASKTYSPDSLISLKRAFEKISDGDRARILIPLDIVLKMMP